MSSTPTMGVRTWTTQVARLGVALLFVTVLLYPIDTGSAFDLLGRISPWIWAATLLTITAGLGIAAWKWAVSLRMHALGYPLPFLVRVQAISVFRGEGYRVLKTLPRHELQSRALSAVLLDRSTALLALLIFGAIGAFAFTEAYATARLYYACLVFAAALGAAFYAAVQFGAFESLFGRWWHTAAVQSVRDNIRLIKRHDPEWTALFVGAFTSQLVAIGGIFLVLSAVDPAITLSKTALIVAIAGAAAALPISIGGLGVMELAFAGAAVSLGVGFEQAVIAAFVHRGLTLALSAGCAVFSRARISNEQKEEQVVGREAEVEAVVLEQAQLPVMERPVVEREVPAVPLAALAATGPGDRPWLSSEILEFTHDAIIIWEMDGAGILYWNQAAEQLYGYSREEACGKTTHALLNTQIAGGVSQLEARIARYGVWVGKLRHTTRENRQVEVEGRLALLARRDGRWLVLEVNRDLTDTTKAQEAQEAAERQLKSIRSLSSRV